VSFVIAPRLNAIGRMDHAMDGLRILLTTDVERAYAIADILKNANKMRQEFTSVAVEEARKIVALKQYSKVCTVVGESWKEGVIGLVASRLVEEVAVPVIAITKMDGHAKGSARSYNGYNIIEAISKVGHLLVDYGGHPGAAGFTVKTEKVDEFCVEINKVFEETYTHEEKSPELTVEAILKTDDLSLATVRSLAQFEPFGLGNEEPLVMLKEMTIRTVRTVGDKGKHLKISLYKDGAHVDAIGFGLGPMAEEVKTTQTYDFVGTLKEDNWNMVPKLQLAFKDFKPSFSS
jgi:single-stranded-DNA-specific exonuclease